MDRCRFPRPSVPRDPATRPPGPARLRIPAQALRHPARILNAECTDAAAPELVLRDDGSNGDLGYAWATLVDKDRALVVYYFNRNDGIRHIAETYIHFD